MIRKNLLKSLSLLTSFVMIFSLTGCLFSDNDASEPIVVVNNGLSSNNENDDQSVNDENINGSNDNKQSPLADNSLFNSTGNKIADQSDDTTIENTIDPDSEKDIDNDGSASGYFTTTDLDGNIITQEIFTHAKINFVNVWGTFCGPCLSEMPDLGELAGEYDPADVQFIGIVCDITDPQDSDIASKYVDKTGADYVHLICNEDIGSWGVNDMQYVPTTLIIDSEGNILYTTVGSDTKENWKALIDSYL